MWVLRACVCGQGGDSEFFVAESFGVGEGMGEGESWKGKRRG